MWFIFDIKPITLKSKARLVIDGHVVNSGNVKTFSSMMSTEGPRILLTIVDHMYYKVGDINDEYLCMRSLKNISTHLQDSPP